ncbi:MAG: winged helix-turn-helix domain-containing protein [Candidatus Muiribacteriota bacterium]
MFKYDIPRPPDVFTGRKRELNKLFEYFDSQKIIVIAGLTGIGKTALLSKLLEKLIEKYPDRYFFWISAKPDWTLDNFFDEIFNWLQDRELDNIIEKTNRIENQHQKIKKLVLELEKNAITFIIDDFQFIENDKTRLMINEAIKNFSKARFVVGTRKRIKLSPMKRVEIFERRLDGLSLEDTKLFIEHLLKKHGLTSPNSETMKIIYAKIQGHPLSVKLLVSLYITGDISFETLVEESSEFGIELENYIMESLFRSLSLEEKKFLTYFSAFYKPVSNQVMEDLIDVKNFSSIKNKLVDLYLIEKNSERKYFIHSILKNYSNSKLAEREKKEIYNNFALYFKQFDDINMKLQAFYYWFEIDKKEEAVKFLITFIDGVFKKGKNEELYNIIENIMENYGKNYPVLQFFKANILLRWGDLKKAELILNNIEKKGDKKLQADIYEALGKINVLMSNNKEAVEYFGKACDLYSQLNFIEGETACFVGLGDSMRFSNKIDSAEEYFNRAKQYITEISAHLKGRVYKGLGDTAFRKRNYNIAQNYFEKAIAIFEEINENFYIGKIRHNLAFLYFELAKIEDCLELLFKLLDYRESINDSVGLIYNFSFVGEIYLIKNNIEKAEYYLKSGLKYTIETDEKRGASDLYLNLIKLYILKKDFDSALHTYKIALSQIEDLPGMEKFCNMFYISKNMINLFANEEVEDKRILELARDMENSMEYSWAYQAYLILRNYFNKIDKSFKYQQKLSDISNKIIKVEMEFLNNFFALKKQDKTIYQIVTSDKTLEADKHTYNEFLSQKEKYDIFVNFAENEIFEKSRGNLRVLKKRTVANVFALFIKNIGKELSFKKIFETVWKREYDPETDAITVRVNISRLRSEIEPDSKKTLYIINARESGYYLFNPKTNYIVINKK